MEQQVSQYISRLLKLQEALKRQPLTIDEYKEIALTSGISETEWNEMMNYANDQARLAKEHLKVKNFQDAFSCAENAFSVNPYLTEAKLIAAEAALGLYSETKNVLYLQEAEKIIRNILKLSPSETQAVKLLARIENFEKEHKKQKKRLFLAAGILGITVLISVLLVILFKTGIKNSNNTPNTNPQADNIKNELIVKREMALSQWAQVQNVLNRQNKLLPKLIIIANNSPDPQIKILQKQIDSLNNLLQNAGKQDKMKYQAQIQNKISEMLSLLNKQQNDKNIQMIIVELEGTYNRITLETKRYNDYVREYNILAEQYADRYPEFKKLPYFGE